MTHGAFTRKCSPSPAPLASAWTSLCRLSATNSWFWLVRPPLIETTSVYALVLFHGLPGLLVSIGEGGLGHG